MPRAAVSVPASRPSTAQELIYPTHGCRDVLRRHGIKPHDHARDNRRHIKELQQQVSERKAAAEAEAAKAASKAARRRAEGAYSAVPSRVAAQLAARPSSAPPSRHRPSPRNFYVGAPLQPAKQPAGKLPSYLIDRKLELAQRAAEKAAAAMPPEVPPHHHLLPREDCERVLADIRAARAEVVVADGPLPSYDRAAAS
ncbi:hypothetical protein EMIHUDRAFT_210977 [Emiliania huxleyi CCMP1516]|uniref:Enkurin domain-containing protein n=2 Tax=Emiliania huxleyi TaxID=2903 RepID=A0A0D3IXL4_EMIH1|nr:hypothetical protein EMIHUDRAFT_210977 [Emiliania huxleyi CCMP1516]EOD15999.1 hypothetical protein EMIHUDRAFT_210977 [Emiliania huxleyi CCMP1516]|eukprot:XP_005768428.1 hypothetical protein EMIHUDRAFT_210977 [Emiliania huxleyi CCMP1516]